MPTLRSPAGQIYRTDDDAEVRNLTLGHGYTVVPEPAPPAEVRPPARRKAAKADERQDDQATE